MGKEVSNNSLDSPNLEYRCVKDAIAESIAIYSEWIKYMKYENDSETLVIILLARAQIISL